jgi:myosin-crossreactive antigen
MKINTESLKVIKMSIESVFFEDDFVDEPAIKHIEAIVEFNEFDQPFAIEVLGLRTVSNEKIAESLLEALKRHQVDFAYDHEVDALTFAFGDGKRSLGQRLGKLELGVLKEDVVLLKLSF